MNETHTCLFAVQNNKKKKANKCLDISMVKRTQIELNQKKRKMFFFLFVEMDKFVLITQHKSTGERKRERERVKKKFETKKNNHDYLLSQMAGVFCSLSKSHYRTPTIIIW
jgi:hypothetical protein